MSNKKFRASLVFVFAIFFLAVMTCFVSESADASSLNDKHGGKEFVGVWQDDAFEKGWGGYVFSEELGNFRNVRLGDDDNADIQTANDRWINTDDGDEIHGGYIDWKHNNNRPESYDDYKFTNSDWRLKDLHFYFGRYCEDKGSASDGENCICVTYGKDSPCTSGKQRFKLNFKITAYKKPFRSKDDIKEFTTSDTFTDKYDATDNGEVLERAGHGNEGIFSEALKFAGEDVMIKAIDGGKIVIELVGVVCDKDNKKGN